MLIPILLGVLLTAPLAAVIGAMPNRSPSAASCTWTLTVPAAAFQPNEDGYHYYNYGWLLTCDDDNVVRWYTAYVPFPCTGQVTVQKVEFMGYDNNAAGDMWLTLYRLDPLAPAEDAMGGVCSGYEFASGTNPETWTITEFDPATVDASQAAYLWLEITDKDDLRAYGVTITYQSCECCVLPLATKQ